MSQIRRILRVPWLTTACLLVFVSTCPAASTEKILYNFSGGATAADRGPYVPLTFDSAGNLYGATGFGSSSPYSSEVFQLVPNPDGTWTENVLYLFPQPFVYPSTPLLIDSAGNLYGASSEGGQG